jgi:SAM-dependent methyltransferase
MKQINNAYTMPEIYELAFSWRDFSAAVDFLIAAAGQVGLSEIKSMVELGSGPGQYCREFGRRGVDFFALDISPEMTEWVQKRCESEKLPGSAIEADFRDFRLPTPVDLACCMLDSACYLLTNRDLLDHLDAVADNLRPDGLYIAEFVHPRDFLTPESSTDTSWEMERDGTKVSVDWCSDATLDYLTEVYTGTVTYRMERDGKSDEYSSRESCRHISLGLLRALIEQNGRFNIAAMYGDLKINQPLDNDPKSWRMVVVLRKFA